MRLIVLLLLPLYSGCATQPIDPPLPRNPILKQIIRWRAGDANPSNKSCIVWDDKGACVTEENFYYDLKLQGTRDLLNDLGFICKVAGKRYKIDPGTPRLRRDDIKPCGFLDWGRCRKSEYIEVENADFIRQANSKCFSAKIYRFDQVN